MMTLSTHYFHLCVSLIIVVRVGHHIIATAIGQRIPVRAIRIRIPTAIRRTLHPGIVEHGVRHWLELLLLVVLLGSHIGRVERSIGIKVHGRVDGDFVAVAVINDWLLRRVGVDGTGLGPRFTVAIVFVGLTVNDNIDR